MSGIKIYAQVPARGVDLDVEIPFGKCTAILGPNGAGKSTLLELISGLVKPASGTVEISGRRVAGPDGFIPVHLRDIGLLAQEPLIFPHLGVLENVAFGPRSRGMSAGEARKEAHAQLEKLGCGSLAEARGLELSGGQAQRVGLARALVTEPQVLLLDEPLAALDAAGAPQMRELLRTHLAGQTTALVTHDLLDVLVLAQHVVVLNSGKVVAHGPTQEVLSQPRDTFLAEFLGVNVLSGQVRDASLELAPGVAVAGLAAQNAARTGWASFPASAVTVHRYPPQGSARNVLRASVQAIEPRGPVVRVLCDLAGQQVGVDVTPQAVAELEIALGEEIFLAIKATAVTLY